MNCNASGFGPSKRELIIPVLGGKGSKIEFKASLGYTERPYLKTKTNTTLLFIYLFIFFRTKGFEKINLVYVKKTRMKKTLGVLCLGQSFPCHFPDCVILVWWLQGSKLQLLQKQNCLY